MVILWIEILSFRYFWYNLSLLLFQQFILINKIMPNYQSKLKWLRQVRRVELIWTSSSSPLAGKFSHLYQKKGARTRAFVYILSSETGYILEKKHYFFFKVFWFGLCFYIKYRRWRSMGYSWVFHKVVLVQGVPSLQQPQPRLQKKTTSLYIFGIQYSNKFSKLELTMDCCCHALVLKLKTLVAINFT